MSQEDGEIPASERTPYDALTKQLADHFAPELLVYLHGLEGLQSCESVGSEVEIVHRMSDRFWKVTEEIEGVVYTYLMHIEFESSYDAHIGRRLGVYGWGLFEKEGLPVKQLVWWVGGKQPSYWPNGEWFRTQRLTMAPTEEVASWIEWREVWLPGGFEAERFLEEAPPFLLPFATKMKGMNKGLLGRLYERIMESELSESNRRDLLVMAIFLFSTKPEIMAEAMEMFDMSEVEQNAFAKYLLNKGLEQGAEQKARQIAQRMLAQGYEVRDIEQLTELPSEEIEALRQVVLQEPEPSVEKP